MGKMTRQEDGLIAIISHSQVLIAVLSLLPRHPSPLSSLPLSLFFSLHRPPLIAPHRHDLSYLPHRPGHILMLPHRPCPLPLSSSPWPHHPSSLISLPHRLSCLSVLLISHASYSSPITLFILFSCE
ncbi:hypothetical protein HID58_048223 [Brassica napus]|uniref:Uncharacterized protein n=1 Tax=Brassica napus TaxID=3708 RepID=A0ABQ8B1G9_BRANA|nr:hypothetical protein HID58_048223 [Brassica napus]